MKNYFNFLFLLILTNIFFGNNTYAKLNKNTDKYYLVFLNTPENEFTNNTVIEKRHENTQFVSSLINEVHELILKNKNTYQDKLKYEILKKKPQILKKRDELNKNNNIAENYKSSSLIYPILNGTILVAYLSQYLKNQVDSNVISCVSNIKFKQAEHYDSEKIFEETRWSSLWAIPDSSRHLSMISQGKYNKTLIGEYDTTYYYPGTAGLNFNIIAIDVGFNFYHYPEFIEDGIRKVECYGKVEGRIVELNNDITNKDSKKCSTKDTRNPELIEGDNQDHGTMVLDIAGGYYQGVAPNANLYGFVNSLRYSDVLVALDYIKNSKDFLPEQTVIIMPFSQTANMENDIMLIEAFNESLRDLNEKGFVVIAASGNEGKNVKNMEEKKIEIPCALNDVICIGGVDENYNLAKDSNYGEGVDIYAPYTSYVSYNTYDDDTINRGIVYGTTFSSGIAAGVVALIKSENSSTVKFNTKKMLAHLQELALKNVINNNPNLYFINNGKKTVYSLNEEYYGCGVNAGGTNCDKINVVLLIVNAMKKLMIYVISVRVVKVIMAYVMYNK